MTLEKQINKIIENMFSKKAKKNNSRRGANIFLEPLTLKFTVKEAFAYLNSFQNIADFITDCYNENQIYKTAPQYYTLASGWNDYSEKRNNTFENLTNHKFWKKETDTSLVWSYIYLMADAFNLSEKKNSRNNVALNKDTCISYIQEICGNLFVVSRSCDFSLGFLADMYSLITLATANDCKKITWTHANLHTYENNIEATHHQYKNKIKYGKFNFNVR